MKTNYHTHTTRCGHASGADEEYVRAAIAQGFDELGFSDHIAWPYASGFTSPTVRMTVAEIGGYLASVRALEKKYAGRIRIRAGFECEHFPEYMGWLRDMAEEKQLDYLILGNHYYMSDETGSYLGRAKTVKEIRQYVESTVKGLESGLFSYLAHPDLFMRGYRKFDENVRAAANDLCAACKALNVPMEFNLHSRYEYEFMGNYGYPNLEFFEIVQREGIPVIIGVDAHCPDELKNPRQWNWAQEKLAMLGIRPLDHIEMKNFGR